MNYNCNLSFYSPYSNARLPLSALLVCNVSFVWSRLVQRCMQALNISGVPQCFASFSVCVYVWPRPGVSLDDLPRYSINMFPLIHPAVLCCVFQRQALSSYPGNSSRNSLNSIAWICRCLALFLAPGLQQLATFGSVKCMTRLRERFTYF